jgi:hypothetical protein
MPTHPRDRFHSIVTEALEVDHLTINGNSITDTSVLLGAGDKIDMNGEADALILDADGDTTIAADTNDQIDIGIGGADDFTFTANTFTALNGSAIATDTITETTAASGVTIDSVLCKDGGIVLAGGAAIAADVVSEKTSAAGVTVDGVLIKDTAVYGRSPVGAVTGDGAITIPAYNKLFAITKAGVAAMTIVDPTATTHDGVELTFMAMTANAHTLDNSAGSGFFSSGGATKDVATFGGAIGDRITIVAYQGKWYIKDSLNITLG